MRNLASTLIAISAIMMYSAWQLSSEAQDYSESAIKMSLQGTAEYFVTDALGRRSGFDPLTGRQLDEIPNSWYGYSGSGDEDNPSGPGVLAAEFELRPAPAGHYGIRVIGNSLGSYRMTVILMREKAQGGTFRFRGLIDSAQVDEFSLVYSPDSSSGLSVVALLHRASLREDVSNSYRLSLLGDRELYKDLTHRLDKLDKYLADKDSSKARHELEKFQEKLDQVRKETVKTEQKKQKPPKHFISKDAYEILTEDVSILLKQLPLDKKGKGEKQSQRLQQKM